LSLGKLGGSLCRSIGGVFGISDFFCNLSGGIHNNSIKCGLNGHYWLVGRGIDLFRELCSNSLCLFLLEFDHVLFGGSLTREARSLVLSSEALLL